MLAPAGSIIPTHQVRPLIRRNRATVSEAELSGVQAARRVTEARLNNGLGATVQASYGFNATGAEFNSAYRNLLDARQFILSVDIPLVQWGARREGIQAAEPNGSRWPMSSRANLEQAGQDAYFAARQVDQARRNLRLSAKADTVAGRRFEVAYKRYVVGRITIDNLYIAQAEEDQAVSQ
jgi:outer membrane protein TolC